VLAAKPRVLTHVAGTSQAAPCLQSSDSDLYFEDDISNRELDDLQYLVDCMKNQASERKIII
jgi:hypothetical protein